MSTIVYHQQGNLQSCFEPQIFEMTATLKLKVPPPPPCHQEVKDLGGWSMLQSLSGINISKDAAGEKEAAVYVHPLLRRPSSSRLSEKSLALCTEALGSETGTDMTTTESSIFSSALSSPEPTSRRREESLPPLFPSSQQHIESRNVTSGAGAGAAYRPMNNNGTRNSRNNNFPPPLTTISGGANSLRVCRPHREDGRLIITAVETPSKRTYLQADRSNGRLRLSFFNAADLADHHQSFDPQITTSEESDGEEFKEESDELEGDINGEDEVAEVQEVEEDEEEEEEESDVYMARDMDGNTSNVEVEMGITQCLLGRCKETGGHSNKGLSQWGEPKTLWVST
ncbi:PREDICTED: protein FANTASTIC FOUR 3 [Ipomoea nil]|uniref:protein FANTASTIC FOUR 3 n=1 Tax=Ipomoea nil TaxID=35883 RepID=UPI000901388E|nr:PREDICTED: protein FANTASTIC FOUR 3 [Ipomoea nil]